MQILILLALLVLALFVVLPVIGLAAWAVISAAVVGLVIGALARLVLPGRQPIGLLATALLGLMGSIIGSFLGYHVFHIGGFTILLEIGVAVVGVALYAGRQRRAQSIGRSDKKA